MEITGDHRGRKFPFLAGFWLIAAIPAALVVLLPLNEILKLDSANWGAASVLALAHFGAGYEWARALARQSGLPETRQLMLAGGLGYSLTFVGGFLALPALQPELSRVRLPFEVSQPEGYLAIFVPWIALISSGTGLALGLGTGRPRTALALLGWGLLIGPVVFLAIALGMGLIGFEIGGSHPPRPTMLPVTLLGAWSVALVGSAVFGRVLSGLRSQQAVGSTREEPEYKGPAVEP